MEADSNRKKALKMSWESFSPWSVRDWRKRSRKISPGGKGHLTQLSYVLSKKQMWFHSHSFSPTKSELSCTTWLLWTRLLGQCGDLNTTVPQGSYIWMPNHQEVALFENIWRIERHWEGFEGVCHWGWSLRFQKRTPSHVCLPTAMSQPLPPWWQWIKPQKL